MKTIGTYNVLTYLLRYIRNTYYIGTIIVTNLCPMIMLVTYFKMSKLNNLVEFANLSLCTEYFTYLGSTTIWTIRFGNHDYWSGWNGILDTG